MDTLWLLQRARDEVLKERNVAGAILGNVGNVVANRDQNFSRNLGRFVELQACIDAIDRAIEAEQRSARTAMVQAMKPSQAFALEPADRDP
jgi:hypothetical protein